MNVILKSINNCSIYITNLLIKNNYITKDCFYCSETWILGNEITRLASETINKNIIYLQNMAT